MPGRRDLAARSVRSQAYLLFSGVGMTGEALVRMLGRADVSSSPRVNRQRTWFDYGTWSIVEGARFTSMTGPLKRLARRADTVWGVARADGGATLDAPLLQIVQHIGAGRSARFTVPRALIVLLAGLGGSLDVDQYTEVVPSRGKAAAAFTLELRQGNVRASVDSSELEELLAWLRGAAVTESAEQPTVVLTQRFIADRWVGLALEAGWCDVLAALNAELVIRQLPASAPAR